MEDNKNNKGSEVGAPSNGMKVLMLSTDRDIFTAGSEVRQRMIDYGKLFEELHVIIFTKFPAPRGRGSPNFVGRQNPNSKSQTNSPPQGSEARPTLLGGKIQISNNVWLYPTNTRFKPLYFFDAYKMGKRIIVDSRFQMLDSAITTQDPFETGLMGYWLKRQFGIPLEVQIHTDFLSPYFWKESIKNKIRVLLAKFLIKKADRLRVVSERIKNSIIVNCKLKIEDSAIEVRPIFVDVEKIRKTPIKTDLRKKYPHHDFIILMASRLTREKNIGLAIEAFASIKHQASSVKNPLLLIVGDGPEHKNLKFKIENLKLQNNVVIEPWTDDLVSYYKTADLFLLTSNYEGYGRTAVEASSAGLPVVMTDVGIALGTVVGVGNKEQLVSAIIGIISKFQPNV